MRILLVENDRCMARALCAALERERYVVDWVQSLATAQEASAMATFDLVLLERTLPDGDGLVLLSRLRDTSPGLRIIVMSACGSISERVASLDAGADDYLIKPFAFEEMLARIRAIRRRPSQLADVYIGAGRLTFDRFNEEVAIRGERLDLPRRELRVLAVLMKRRGRTVLRESLEQAVFGFDDEIQSNTLNSHISRLRRKLTRANAGLEIHGIRGVGYQLREVRGSPAAERRFSD